jgi:PhzF family phenazine biosynthesis protein
MQVNVFQVDSFTNEKFTGNAAGVVPHADELSEKQMQQIARELNNSETVFILSPDADDHDVHVRFFTPTVEVPSCGHATIAAHHVRACENELGNCTIIQKSKIGKLPVDIVKENDSYEIYMTQGEPKFSKPFDDIHSKILLTAFGLTETDIYKSAPIQFVDTGHGKVLLCINNLEKLHNLKPDFTRLIEISSVTGYKGFFVFTLESDSPDILTHGRMFAPAIGINEDPVTGNGNGPVGAYLVKHNLVKHDGKLHKYKGKQGEAMGRPGIIDVEVTISNNNPVKVRIGGRAITVFKTTIQI